MFPGMNPRDMQKAMKRLGIQQEEIDAEEVIIRTASKDLVIKNPQVSRVNMMGQETIQVIGDIVEVEKSGNAELSQDDIETVMGQTDCTREAAVKALEDANGNLAEAILILQNK